MKKHRITSELITTPAMAAVRLAPRTHPLMLTISANGGVRSIASPPRTASGEPQPGLNRGSSRKTVGATKDRPNPILPAFNGPRAAGSAP